jgi:hypothetical protein
MSALAPAAHRAAPSLGARLLAPVGVLLAFGCATAPADPDTRNASNVALAPYALHEECLALRPGDRLDYRFRSSVPIAFNIHYHDAQAVVMPVQRDGVTADSGIYQPVLAHDFCLMWEAGAAAATLDYRVTVRRRQP